MMTNDASDDADAGFGIVPRHLRGHLTLNEIGVYVGLSWRANRYGKLWIRHKRLAEEVGSSVSTVQRALRGLRDKGVITWEPRIGPDGSADSNIYTLHVYHQTTPPGQIDRGDKSERPGGSVDMTGEPGQIDRQNETPRTRPLERDSTKQQGGSSAVVKPSVTRAPKSRTTPTKLLDGVGLARRDHGRFKEWLRTAKGARSADAVIATGDPEDIATQVREWRSTLDITIEPDAEPVLCDHGHDVALGAHMCPMCDPARNHLAPGADRPARVAA